MPIIPRSGVVAVLVTGVTLLAPVLAQSPSSRTYVADLEALFADIDGNYPFFDAKGIRKPWQDAKKDLLGRAGKTKDDASFVRLVQEALAALRDGHAFFKEVKPKLPDPPGEFYPGFALLPATEGRVVVIATPPTLVDDLPVGTVVTKIDGVGARDFLEKRGQVTWAKGGAFSSPQRARFFEFRLPLRGARGAKYRLEVQKGKGSRKIELEANRLVEGWVHLWNPPAGLTAVAKSVSHAPLPSGIAYVSLRRLDESAAKGLAAAREASASARGLIIDLRGNTGGGYDDSLLDEVKKLSRPVAVLLDAGCISAGETLARDLKKLLDATLLGETTAGSSTQKREFRLPSGLATIQYSVRSRFGPDGTPIEFNGIKPDLAVEAVPEEIRSGKDSLVLRAEELLLGRN